MLYRVRRRLGPYYRRLVRNIRRKFRGLQEGGVVTFRQFVHYLISQKFTARFNDHWRPFHECCLPCHVHYDFIGHLETLEEDSRYVIDELGFRSKQLPSWYVNYNASRLVTKMFANVTTSEIRRLAYIYRLDFVLFGYSVNSMISSPIY